MTSYRTPLARARGLGPARAGTDHFWRQRLTAVANVFLVSFAIFLIVKEINRRRKQDEAVTTKDCPHCLSAIPIGAARCAHCCTDLPAAA